MQVTVWWATPRDPRELDVLLDDADRAHLAWLQKDRVRSASATSRALLRGALGSQGVITRACPDCDRPHGRPLVDGRHVSTSHTDGLVAVAITDAPVGVDVELADPSRFADLEFTPTQWTRREAYLKALGVGLRIDPATVTPVDVVDVDLGANYAAALCVPGQRATVEVIGADDLLGAWAASPRTATA